MADDAFPVPPKRRSCFSIMAEVLEATKKGALKTQIMYQASLSFSHLNKCLSLLLDRGLLEASKASKKTIYKTTEKGLRYLRGYRKTMKLLKEGKGNNPTEVNLLHLIDCGSRVIVGRA